MTRGAVRVTAAARRRASEIYAALQERYPDAHCELVFDAARPHELLVATILSAQATDVSVNKVTPGLFAAFPSVRAFAEASAGDIEPFIKSIGLFRNKAKAIQAAMLAVVERFGGEVPRTMEELLTLRGVARKTANVVLGNAFGINQGVVVDTHVERLSKRFGLVPQDANVARVEARLMALFPLEQWCMLSHLLIFHGRRVCKARGGACAGDSICLRFCREAKR
ncbi:MAG: endonuclease III [Phycisphaerales bacterium]